MLVTEDELVKIDAQGRQIGNTFVQGIFAGIDDSQNYDNNGNWAETVGRLMHFSGDFGAVQIAKDAIEKAKKQEADFDWESWFKENSINTKEEVDKWLEIAQAATNAADARKKYTEGIDTDKTDNLWDYSTTITQLDEMEKKFSSLDNAYSKLFDEDSNIGFEDYSSIYNAFKDIEGLDISNFVQQLQEAGQDTEKVNAVMSDLIATYLDCSGVMENLNEENAALIEQALTEMGIENAHEIVMAQLSAQTEILALQKQFLTEKGYDLCDATVEEINQFLEMSDASDIAKQSIAQLALETINFANINLDQSSNIEQLIALANAAGASATAVAKAQLSRHQHMLLQEWY